MYEALTRSIRVQVVPKFMDDQSTPEESYYFWTYRVRISNEGGDIVQLRSRHWRITDAQGRTEQVRGPGVVGKTPVLRPGESFVYTSGCPLRTPSGIMFGSYEMVSDKSGRFEVAIPAFSLDSPFARRSMN